MIDGLKPYSDYRDSDLPWLGKIPSHWEVRRNGRLFVQRNETGFPDLPILEVSLKTGVRVRDMENLARKQVMSDKEKYKRAEQGDIAYNMMRMWQGAVGVAPVDGLISPAYVVARPLPDTESWYYQYLFRTGAYMNEVNKFSRGIVSVRNRLYWEDFKQIPSPFPPPEEQAVIVRFLDHADRGVRRYIQAKRRLIELLKEQKQAIIHRAVTRGLDPNVSLKPSGVEWLGDVPEHWQSFRLKQVTTKIEQGWSPQCDARQARDSEWGVLKVGCVNGESFDPLENKKLPSRLSPIDALEIRDGDILVSRANTRELLGLAAIASNPRRRLILCDKLFRFRALPARALPPFLVVVIRSKVSRAQIERRTNGASASMQNIGQDVIRNLHVALPPLDEQRSITDSVSEQTAPLRWLTNCARKQIRFADEYRTCLIADAVTGKLDVRDAASRLPDEAGDGNAAADDLLEGEELSDDADLDSQPEEAEV